jgi:hypothetical protein
MKILSAADRQSPEGPHDYAERIKAARGVHDGQIAERAIRLRITPNSA